MSPPTITEISRFSALASKVSEYLQTNKKIHNKKKKIVHVEGPFFFERGQKH